MELSFAYYKSLVVLAQSFALKEAVTKHIT
jgi:phosphopantetheinyl transferase (holo-ACP synthase)